MSSPKNERNYTYADYLEWPEDVRVEIIDGTLYMQAAPSRIHQKILSELHRQIANYLVGKDCEVYPAPFHVVLDMVVETVNEEESSNVVEPDITIVCDESLLDEKGCKGVPDMIIEITSPSTGRKDKMEKFNKYEHAGVKEYWIVEPQEKMISVFTLLENLVVTKPFGDNLSCTYASKKVLYFLTCQKNQRFGRPDLYSGEDQAKVSILHDLVIDLDMVFAY